MAGGALPGFRDFYPDEFAQRAHIFRAWREVARRYAFVEYDGPPLEPLDLYTKKSGDEIVGQLYNFTDKGGREVALRPEMTPTFARMVGERAASLRKPVRWFSIPQLFRYERAQRGRLREHYQLNVDIVGEASELADAELLSFAIDVMRELGLGPTDVRVRVSDRQLLVGMLESLGIGEKAHAAVFETLDKTGREQQSAAQHRLAVLGLDDVQQGAIFDWQHGDIGLANLREDFEHSDVVGSHLNRMSSYFGHLQRFGVADWVDLDLKIVRGLAYYTGIVFELFDAKGELRAICGGGRYDTLLASLGGADLPALGFGMGDVVLGELLKARKLMPSDSGAGADLYFVGGNGVLAHPIGDALVVTHLLRTAGLSVDYALSAERYGTQPTRNQVDSARKSGARAAIYFESESELVVQGLAGKLNEAPKQVFHASSLLASDPVAIEALKHWVDTHLPPRIT